MNTTFYFHPLFLEHDTGSHPERPERLRHILSILDEKYVGRTPLIDARRASFSEIEPVHKRSYLDAVEGLCGRGGGYLDPDTPVSPASFEAALHAAGALLDGADALMAGETRSAFGLVRPPGHHARPATGMGFCVINNIAVAATYLRRRHGLERVLIVDFDVHHGNGTQESFYRDGSVFFLSMHRFPFYPGTGWIAETGEGPGTGATLNLPIAADEPPESTVAKFEEALEAASQRHSPQIILVSAGFDAYADDPVGGLGLQPQHFGALGRVIQTQADRFCGGRVLSSLEGGYSLTGLPDCLAAYVEELVSEA